MLRRGLIGGVGWRTIRSRPERGGAKFRITSGRSMGAINQVAVRVAGIAQAVLGACWRTVFANAWKNKS
jgi:hypothetical protein